MGKGEKGNMNIADFDMNDLLNNPNCIDEFSKGMGMKFIDLTPGKAVCELTIDEKMVNPLGSVHGGVLFSLADITAGTAAVMDGVKVTTLDSQISFLSPAFFEKTKHLYAKANKVKAGKTIYVLRVDIYDEQDKLISTASFTFFIMK